MTATRDKTVPTPHKTAAKPETDRDPKNKAASTPVAGVPDLSVSSHQTRDADACPELDGLNSSRHTPQTRKEGQ